MGLGIVSDFVVHCNGKLITESAKNKGATMTVQLPLQHFMLMKLGILREYKEPQDNRVPLSPKQCALLLNRFNNLQILVEPYENRCFSNEEYLKQGIEVGSNMDSCDVLLGVKEVPIARLLTGKTYLFFSHTIKKQSYNKALLKTILEKNIRLIDHETLVDGKGERIIGFGRWAGIVGAHYAIMMIGRKWKSYQLNAAHQFKSLADLKQSYTNISFPAIKIALTGTGRVGKGALEILQVAGIKEVSPLDFLKKSYLECVFTVLKTTDLYKNSDGTELNKKEFYKHPNSAISGFGPFAKVADVLINGIYWDFNAARLFTKTEAKKVDFNIKLVSDITCDVDGSVPYTLRQTSTKNPYLSFDLQQDIECAPFTENSLDIMAIGNLPNELPRDASIDFGNSLINSVIPELFNLNKSEILNRAMICENKHLTPRFEYLKDWVFG